MPTKWQVLYQERTDLRAEGQKLLDKGERTEAEDARLAEITTRVGELNAEIEAEERAREAMRQVPAQAPVTGATVPAEARDHRNGFADVAEFGLSVARAGRPGGAVDPRLMQAAPSNYHQETGTAEGYMVPAAFREAIWEVAANDEDVLSEVDMEPTERNAVEYLKDESTPWGTSGVKAYWRTEVGQMSGSKMATALDSMRLFDLYAFVLATDDLLQDAPRLNQRLTTKAGAAIRWTGSDAIYNGNGVGKPLGWTQAACKISVSKESGQAAATVVAANVAKMFARVLNPGQAVWKVNPDVLPQLVTMTLGNQPIWTPPASGFQNAPGGFLFGRPVQFSEHCQTLGTVGDIQLVQPKGYYAITKAGGPQFAQSMHLYFDYGMQAFRWTFRMNGQPYLSAAVSPANGSNTRSHFVLLETRG